MFIMRNMASMVRTYMMLCIAGLVVTICILMVMYNGTGSDVREMVVKVDASSDDAPPSQREKEISRYKRCKCCAHTLAAIMKTSSVELINRKNSMRGIKGTNFQDKVGELVDQQPDMVEDYSDDGDDEEEDGDEADDEVSSYSSDPENAWLDQEKKLEEKTEQGISMKLAGEYDTALRQTKAKEDSRTSSIRIVGGDEPQTGGSGGIRANAPVMRGDIPVVRDDIIPGGSRVGLNQSASQMVDANRVNADGNGDVVQPEGKSFRITENGDLELMDASKKSGGGSTMLDMRISGTTSKFKQKYNGGVQDLLRHPEEHMFKETKKDCQPKNNIVMVKTHKCSSSTMQNIIFRWGENHNLTFAFPRSGVYLGSPSPFTRNAVMESNNGHYNIIANHMVFNQQAIEDLMPADSVYIGLLRNPDTQYESMYNYYRFDGRYRVTLEHFLKRPRLYFENEPHFTKQVGRNPMLFDIGLDARHLEKDDPRVTKYVQQLAQRFDVVLIAEYFKESLILLKDALCWDMDDIVFFNQNARSKISVRPPTDAMKQRIRAWNSGDTTLYQFFNRTLWQKIEAFGYDRMAREVAELERRNAELSQLCIGATRQAGDKRVYYPPGVQVKSFVLNSNAHGNHLCEQMTRPELTYIGLLRQKQIDLDSKRGGR